MSPIRTAAIAFALSTATLVAGASLFLSQTDVTDRFVTAVVDQAFGALDRIPVPSAEMQAALRPVRADRAEVAKSDAIRPTRSVTVEQRIDGAMSTLVRLPMVDVAGR